MSRPSSHPIYASFPLRIHRNGYWYKSVWNPRTKRSELFYFGKQADDPKGDRAISDPVVGWLARRPSILAGVDNVRVLPSGEDLCLGELMSRFLTFKRNRVQAGELSLTTLGDYVREVQRFVAFFKASAPAGNLRPEHFTAYMTHLIDQRNLGRHARKRVRAMVTAFLRFGSRNGWYAMPNTGTDWVAPATDPDSMRQAKARGGIKDNSERVLSDSEMSQLLLRASPTFKALILLGINTGLGPADLGRLTWDRIDLVRRRLNYPRLKTGAPRVGYLWKRTRAALLRLKQLKGNRAAIEKLGDGALVFITRRGRPYYSEKEVHSNIDVNGTTVRKLMGVAVSNAITLTFTRMARENGLTGVTFYRLRHSFKTYGKKARDREALDLMMGHRDPSTGRIYDHEDISWRRIRQVALVVHRQLWPNTKLTGGMPLPSGGRHPAHVAVEVAMTAQPTSTLALSALSHLDQFESASGCPRQH